MITWTVTAFTADTTTDAGYTTSAEPSLAAARRAAGDAALAALNGLAYVGTPMFLSVTIDTEPVLIMATQTTTDASSLISIRELQRAETPAT